MHKNAILTIGVFDGVHIGHKAVIGRAVKRARELGTDSVAITFDPHPMKVIHGSRDVPSLISLKHRIKLIRDLGIDKVMVINFNSALANMRPEAFVKDIIIGMASASEIFVGEDFRFGSGAQAGVKTMKDIGERLGLKVRAVRHVKKRGKVVSSSMIRRFVVAGRIREASELLGRPYSVLGTVIRGAALARSLGYPTANINPHHEAVPPSGVYAVKVKFKDKLYKGVMNIGVRPTFYDHGRDVEPSMEVHIFGFNGRIYGKEIEVIFVKRIRSERKFKTIDSLIARVRKDERVARSILASK